MSDHWLATTYAAAMVTTNERRTITDTAPIYRKFIGQNLDGVVRRLWLARKLVGCALLADDTPSQMKLFEMPEKTPAVTAYRE